MNIKNKSFKVVIVCVTALSVLTNFTIPCDVTAYEVTKYSQLYRLSFII